MSFLLFILYNFYNVFVLALLILLILFFLIFFIDDLSDFCFYFILLILLILFLILFSYIFNFNYFISLLSLSNKFLWIKNFKFRIKFLKFFRFNKFCGISSIFFSLFGFRIDNYWECGSHNTKWERDNDPSSPIYRGIFPDFIKNGDDLKDFINSPFFWYFYIKEGFNDIGNPDFHEKSKIVNHFIRFKASILNSDSNELYLEMLQDFHNKKHWRLYEKDMENSLFSKDIDVSKISNMFTDMKVLEEDFFLDYESSGYSISSFPSSTFSPKSSDLDDNADNFPAGWDAFELYKYVKERKKKL